MKKRLIIIFLLILLILIFINSNYLISNIITYTDTFINNLFFYTFIIFVISSLLIDNDLLDLLNPISFISIMSLISGFPSGSKYIRELYDKDYINSDTCNYLITYCHYPNPLFVIGSVSQLIGIKYSTFVLFSIYISNFITSRLFKVKSTFNTNSISKNYNFMNSLTKAINNSFKTIIIIYGTSILSLIIGLLITKYISCTGVFYSIILGIFDLTKGIFSTILINNKRIRAILILLFINFGSLSIHLQVNSIINNTPIKYKNYFKGRLISTTISLIILLIIIQV